MWDIRDVIYGFFMSGDSSFSLSSAIALCATEQPFMSSVSLGEAILGSDEQPGILENMWEALIKGVRASGSSFQSATQTAGAANNIRAFRSAQAEFNVTAALTAARAGRG